MGLSLSELMKLGKALKSWRAGAAATALLLAGVLYKAYSGELHFFSGAFSETRGEFPELGGATFPHYSALTPSFLSSIWPLSLGAILLALVAVRLAWTIANARSNSQVDTIESESGSSAVEFVLVLPPLVVLLLMILQIALVVQAKFVVNYAAFCAVRSAIVIIPDSMSPEASNQLASPNTSEKIEIIHHAAALPLTAISPRPDWTPALGSPLLSNLGDATHLLLLAPFDVTPRSMMEQAIIRAPYAYDTANTDVKVLTQEGAEGRNFKEHDFVTVRVTYRYYLAVPFAKKLFGTAYSGNPFSNFLFGTEYYYSIVEEYTLPMDGERSGL